VGVLLLLSRGADSYDSLQCVFWGTFPSCAYAVSRRWMPSGRAIWPISWGRVGAEAGYGSGGAAVSVIGLLAERLPFSSEVRGGIPKTSRFLTEAIANARVLTVRDEYRIRG